MSLDMAIRGQAEVLTSRRRRRADKALLAPCQPIAISSSGYLYWGVRCLAARATMKVIGPTLPRNITTEIRILPNVLRYGETSSERPTVPNAEVTSKRAGRSSSPSETISARVLRRTSKEAAARTESALETRV